MPFAQIYMIEGRTEEQKKAVIEKVTQALHEAVGKDVLPVEYGGTNGTIQDHIGDFVTQNVIAQNYSVVFQTI